MRPALIVFCAIIFYNSGFAQGSFTAIIKDSETGEPLVGATAIIRGTAVGASADDLGRIQFHNVPAGEQTLEISFVGYREKHLKIRAPHSDKPQIILLEADNEELEEIVITSTRSSRTNADIPTRVEFIAGEELDEKANMKPGDIRMLLSESTGIQTQQTSPTSANASIRIQGLDGRYTQILKDGFPLYAGFSGGLGLLQTPPLDLKQVEVIKGSSSTLYGGGAIAGMVNLVSRTPSEDRDLKFFVNGTSAKGLDVSAYYGEKFNKVGVTLFASRNSSEPYDPAHIDLTAIPKFERYSFNPKLFIHFNEKTNMMFGVNLTTEDRIGGDIKFIQGRGDAIHRYYENNESRRYSTQLSVRHKMGSGSLNFKNSLGYFDRLLEIPSYNFDGVQKSTFTEINFSTETEKSEWIFGVNLWTDKFAEKRTTPTPLRNYNQVTFGAFVQNNVYISEKIRLETGLRGDYVVDYGFVFLPRASLLYRDSEHFSSRIGGGIGYKAPTIFTEESERRQFQNVLPVSADLNRLEKSYGANWDLNYRTRLGLIGLTINHLFFYTYLNDPLVLSQTNLANYYEFVNLSGFTDSKGTETNVKAELGDFKLFIGYTFTDTRIHSGGTTVQNPLTAKHRLNNVLMYEVEERWKVGLEAYYFSEQRLTDGVYGRDYWICGFMVERMWEKVSLFINFENFLDARQTRFDSIYTGEISDPVFRDIYAPVDGFVINGGVKLNL